MSSKDWKRPTSVPMGKIWDRFTGRALPSGVIPKFVITDFTDDLMEQVIENMKEHYLRDEPLGRAIGAANDKAMADDLTKMWKWCLSHKIGLVCLVENCEEIPDMSKLAGCNITYPCFRDSELPPALTTPVQHYVKYCLDTISLYDCYTRHQTPMVLSAFGLSVDRKWRGHKIGEHLLAARLVMGRAMGFTVGNGIFSSPFSQAQARKVGFQVVAEMKASDYLVDGKPYFGKADINFELHIAKI